MEDWSCLVSSTFGSDTLHFLSKLTVSASAVYDMQVVVALIVASVSLVCSSNLDMEDLCVPGGDEEDGGTVGLG